MKIALIILLGLFALILWRPGFTFRAQKPEDYKDTNPSFDLRQHLSGELESEGVIFGPNGRATSRFVADFTGIWNGASGELGEVFNYDNGTVQNRKWFLTLGNDGTFTAKADDILGVGQGQISGSTVRLTYSIRLTEAAGGHVLDVVDWMYLMDNGTIMNRSEMRKFGIKVAELIATIRPKGN
ncbi:DUF3833 family protein [Tropicibacter sp. R16_0]|uniref:DUF3833 family protein n=1 Tax=Tropicibacter sp. R16_0 TaxID=2821102 RepID=UPI001ADA5B0F|nr:DUF3833 family protein [Tropicibacter sp. R16_0]MBO9449890.1 DUF3833 family protein [Tropicibacter sp. R16_0]